MRFNLHLKGFVTRILRAAIVTISSVLSLCPTVLGQAPFCDVIESRSAAERRQRHSYWEEDPELVCEPIVPTLVPLEPGRASDSTGRASCSSTYMEKKTLFGDWAGYRSRLADSGITCDLSSTQYYQGVAAGGFQQGFRYGGRNDYFVDVDGEKVGFWKGLVLSLHGETRYGQSIDPFTGAFMPTNLMLDVPQASGTVTALTAVKVTQFLSDDMLVYAGRLNMFDSFYQPITGAGPLNGFMNDAMIFNPVYGRTIPYSTYGAGLVYMKEMEPIFSVSVVNTANTPTVSGFDSFFTNGVTILGILNLPTRLFEMPGHQGVTGIYSTGKYSLLEPIPYFNPVPGSGLNVAQSAGSWCVVYNFDQALYVSPNDPKKIWGVFGNLGISDGNPNPVRWSSNFGISGASPIPGRLQDSFGVGYYYLDVTDSLKDLAPAVLKLKNEQGVELYYNYAITPWFHLTPDIQIVDPFKQRADTSFVAGMRGKINF